MTACPTDFELSCSLASPGSADSIDGAADITAHVETCDACRGARDGLEQAIAIARRIPFELPSPIERDRMRAAVIAGVRDALHVDRSDRGHRYAKGTLPVPLARRRRRPGVITLGVAVTGALAASFAWLARTPDAERTPSIAEPTAHAHGTVRGRPGAQFTLTVAPDEIVRLATGVIDVDVAPLHPGERFRVVVGDAEIEVRGTSFVVVAEADRLVSVAVHHGRVDVRPRHQPTTTLGAGQAWRAPSITAPEPEALEAPPKPAPRPARARAAASAAPAPEPIAVVPPPAKTPARSPEELAYDEAWTAMRGANFARAAAAFARVFLLAPDGALAEDAGYWHAVALARGDRNGQAIAAFRDWLRAHPSAPRRGEASAMLGWLLVDTRAYAEAEQHFRTALASPRSAQVHASARDGLAAIAHAR